MYLLKIKKTFPDVIPYQAGSLEWHLWLDIVGAFFPYQPTQGLSISLSDVSKANTSEIDFYLENLAPLIADGYVELEQTN